VVQQNTVNNHSSPASSIQWQIDRTAPVAPIITSPAVSPYVTEAEMMVVAGNCEVGGHHHSPRG
jgi:hypothetical protein